MNAHATIRSAVALIVGFGITLPASAQTCTTYQPPEPPGTGANPLYDQFQGTLAITFEKHVGALGSYTSTFRVEGSASGLVLRKAFRYLQLRIKETGVVYATVPIQYPDMPPGPVTVFPTIGAGIQCKSATNPQRTVQLVVASDATDTAIWADVIAEIVLRTPDPLGSITIPNPTCFRSPSGAPCTVDLQWESKKLAGRYLYLYITAESPVWEGRIWRSTPIDAIGQANSGNIKINKYGVTFRLIASNLVYSGSQYAALRAEGRELGQATAVSVPADGIVCPIDRLPMRRLAQEPTAFQNVLANAMYFKDPTMPELGGVTREGIAEAATLFSQAKMKYLRRTIRWDKLVLDNQTGYDWGFYDYLFQTFDAAGIEPWITFSGTRTGFGDKSLGAFCNPPPPANQPPPHAYPLAATPAAEAAWTSFVAQAIARYGPGGTAALAHPCRNWEIRQEPDVPSLFCGDFDQWRRIYDLARPVILSFDPDARLWVTNMPIGLQKDPIRIEEWLGPTLNSGLQFEGIAVHVFTPEDTLNMRLVYNGVRSIRTRIDRAFPGQSIPLYITACSHLNEGDDYAFRRGLTPEEQEQFYLDLLSLIANAGADAAMWFDAVEHNSSNCFLSPDLNNPPPHHLPNPIYCGALRIAHWLEVGQ